jgi:ATP-binding cassette, subfamily B, bacterial MsbA
MIRRVLRPYLVVRFTHQERVALKAAILRLFNQPPLLLITIIATTLLAAIFEGGTIGLLGFAVSVLVEGGIEESPVVFGKLQSALKGVLVGRTPSGIFLLFVGIAIVAQVLKSICLFVSQALQVVISTNLRRDLQAEVTARIMNLSYPAVMKYPSGRITGYVEEASSVREIVDLVLNLLRATSMTLAYLALMMITSASLTFVSLFVIILLWVALGKLISVVKTLSAEATAAKVFTWRWTIEFFSIPRLLRIFGSNTDAANLINSFRNDVLYPERKSALLVSAVKPMIEIFATVGAGVFLVVGFLIAGDGAREAIPSLFVFVIVLYRLKPQIQAFNDVRIKIAKIIPRLDLIFGFLTETNDNLERTSGCAITKIRRGIEFKDITFSYPDAEGPALSNISFVVKKGEMIALVGPSGGGKSTIANLLLGLYQGDSGQVLIDGKDIATYSLEKWRRLVGYVDQDVTLLNTTIEENIKFGRQSATFEEVRRATDLAHATEFVDKTAKGFQTILGDRAYMLSGGQRQRLSLARALVRDPELLILDEATSALDSMSEEIIHEAILRMQKERTVVVIAHRLSTIEEADLIIYLENGKIVEQGTKDALLNKGGAFAKMWSLQRGESYTFTHLP